MKINSALKNVIADLKILKNIIKQEPKQERQLGFEKEQKITRKIEIIDDLIREIGNIWYEQ